jgi:CPA2 family monovalent cation:H+ antiporter-2
MTSTHQALPYFREIVLFLVLAGVLIPLLGKWRINQVLGFLAAGVLVGPFGAGRLSQDWPVMAWFTFPRQESVASLAELGVIFLMFTIGLELSFKRLITLRHWVFGVGLLQMSLTTFFVAVLCIIIGFSAPNALMIGLILSFSSTAVVMQLLRQRKELSTPMGRSVFSTLLMQDLAVVPLLLTIGLLGVSAQEQNTALNWYSTQGVFFQILLALIKAVAVVSVIYFLARKVLGPLFFWLGSEGNADSFVALTLLATLGISALTWLVGLSLAMGALLAGLLLAETEFRHRVALTIEPFTGLLLGLFFMSVGMGVNLIELFDNLPTIVSLSILLMLSKAAIAAFALKMGGMRWATAIEGGVWLGQGGEFAFVVIAAASVSGFLNAEVGQSLMLLVAISMFLTPLAGKLGRLCARKLDHHFPPPDDVNAPSALKSDHKGHMIIIGFGRVGQAVVDALESQHIPVLIIDRDVNLVRKYADKHPIFVGDIAHDNLLTKLSPERAIGVVLTLDQTEASLSALAYIRRFYPHLPVIARARDDAHAKRLCAAHATSVVPETLEAGLQLSSMTLAAAGIPEDAVLQWAADQREMRYALIRSQKDSGINAGVV